jgi:hypothetical protein
MRESNTATWAFQLFPNLVYQIKKKIGDCDYVIGWKKNENDGEIFLKKKSNWPVRVLLEKLNWKEIFFIILNFASHRTLIMIMN